ncbi:MAG: DUF2200 domain-containing protein [Nitritalea sp.]
MKIFHMPLADIYPHYMHKVTKKGRTEEELETVITWLTGYTVEGLREQLAAGYDLATFFAQAPALHPNASLITGVLCGQRIEEIEDPLLRRIRYMDKLVDELAKGRKMEKILRKA